MQQQRRLAAILFTDIVGFTAMMQQNEALAVAAVKHYLDVLKNALASHEGEILNDYGDGSLCVFPSATEAMHAAIELQNKLNKNPTVPLRIGLHIGEIFFENGKVFGDGVNVASRIQSLGQANSILFSGEINNQIKNHPEFRSSSLGKFEFKNVGESIEVFALTNEGLVIPQKDNLSGKLKETLKKSSRKKLILPAIIVLLLLGIFAYKSFWGNHFVSVNEKTIAILPFKNISVNKEENEPLCVGLVLELQKKLELMGGLIPIASQSVEKFRDTKLSVGDIAGELGDIKYLVQGNVQRDKNKVKVFVALIDAASNKEIWSDDFTGEVEDIFSLQENIAQQIASSLQVRITPDEQNRIGRIATKNAVAIDAYNDALTSYVRLASAVHPLFWDSLVSNPQLYSEYRKTLLLCDKAIDTDPTMAEAYALKGGTYFYNAENWYSSKIKWDQLVDSARFYGNKALAIDKSSTDALLLIANCLGWYRRGDSALTYLEKALAINANNFDVNRQLALYYTFIDPEKGIRFCKKAIRLNPLSVWTPGLYTTLGIIYHSFGAFDKAELYGRRAIELSDNSMITIEAVRVMVIIYLHWSKPDSVIKYANQYVTKETNFLYEIAEAYCNLKNDCARAAALYEELWNRYKNHSNPHRWAVALLNIGKAKEAAEKIKQAAKEYKERNDTLSYDYAGICALKGDKERALKILRKINWQWGTPYLIQQDKLFDNLRNEKEFKEILQKALDEKKKLREKITKMEVRGEI